MRDFIIGFELCISTSFNYFEKMNNWKETTLGEIGRIVTGKTPSINNPEYWGEGLDFITPTDIKTDSKYLQSVNRKLSDAGKDVFKRMIVPENSVIVTCIGSDMGKVIINKKDCVTNQQINSLIVNDNFDTDFIYYLLKNAYKIFRVNAEGGGSTMPIINKSAFEKLSFLLPPVKEQKQISAVLSSLDDKIELLRKQNETLEKIAQGIFKEWFVNFTIDGKKLKLKNGVPEGWRVGKLGDEFKIIMGQSPSGESYNENGEGMIFFQGRAEFQERFPKVRLFTTEPKRVAEKFDVLVSVRAPVGDINVAFDKCCIGRGVGAVRSDQKSYALYRIKSLKEAFDKFEAEGTVFGSINKDGFLNIKVIIPPMVIVKNFEEVASPIDQKIFNNYSQIQNLFRLRDTLLSKLMSGEVDVK